MKILFRNIYIERIDVYDNETIEISLKGFLGGRKMRLNE